MNSMHTHQHIETIRKAWPENPLRPIDDQIVIAYRTEVGERLDSDIYESKYFIAGVLWIKRYDKSFEKLFYRKPYSIEPYTLAQINILFNLGLSDRELVHMKLSGGQFGCYQRKMSVEDFVGDDFSFLV